MTAGMGVRRSGNLRQLAMEAEQQSEIFVESLIILLGSSSHLLLSIMLQRLIFKLRCWPAVCGTRQHGVGVIDCSDLVVTDIV